MSNAPSRLTTRIEGFDAVLRVYDESGSVIETHEHEGDFFVLTLARNFLIKAAFPKEVKSMKRKITGAILISLSLGILWQALAQGLPKGPCEMACDQKYRECKEAIPHGILINPLPALRICLGAYERCRGNCTVR